MKTWVLKLVLGIAGLMLREALVRLQGKNKRKDMDELMEIAQDHVELMQKQAAEMAPDDKHAAVFRNIQIAMENKNVTVQDAMINLAIELAVNALKAKERK
jgi:hypothetical protein